MQTVGFYKLFCDHPILVLKAAFWEAEKKHIFTLFPTANEELRGIRGPNICL